jgi:O-antigen/teichoic acid export membrane protein
MEENRPMGKKGKLIEIRGLLLAPNALLNFIRGKGEAGSSKVETAVSRPLWRFAHDVLSYLPQKIALSVISFLNVFLFTRLLSPEAYGVYSLVMAIIGPAVVLLTEWAAQPIGRYYSEYKMQRLPSYPATISTLLAITIFGGGIVAIGFLFFVGYRWGILMGIAAALLLFLQALHQLVLPIVPASLDPSFYGLVQVSRALLTLGLSVGLAFLIGPRPEFLLWGAVFGFVAVLPLLLRRVSREIGELRLSFSSTPDLRRFARYGVPLMVWFFAAQLLYVGDRYVLQAFRGSAEVGIYSASYNLITGVAGFLGAPITMAAFPIIMHMWAHNRRDSLRQTLTTMTEWYLLLGIGLVGCTALGANLLLSLALGAAFREGYSVLLPVLAGQILWQASMLGHKGMELMERTYWMLILACIAAIINLVLNLILVPSYGYVAAAYTTLLSYGLYTFLIWVFSRRFVPWSIPFRSVVLAMIIATSAAGIAQVVQSGSTVAQALLRILIFSSLYVTGVAIMERKVIQQVLHRRLSG